MKSFKIDGMGTGYHRNRYALPGFPMPENIRRLYPDRIILIPTFKCPFRCEYCFRGKEVGGEKEFDMQPAYNYIERWNRTSETKIRDVILSGGELLSLSNEKLSHILDKLWAIPGVEMTRIDTRFPVAKPERINEDFLDHIDGKVTMMTLHCVHSDEITSEMERVCKKILRRGVILRSYTPMLKGINDNREILKELFWKLLFQCSVIPYYLVQFIETPGAESFRTPLEKSMELVRGLQTELSGPAIPNLIVYLPDGGGKYIVGPNERILDSKDKRAGIKKAKGGYKIPSPLYPGKYSFYPE
jgi:lysine 2,3-aminomutase